MAPKPPPRRLVTTAKPVTPSPAAKGTATVRKPPPRPGTATARAGSAGSSGSVFAQGREEQEKVAARKEVYANKPFPLRLKSGESGRKFIILDGGTPETFFRMYQHQWKGQNGKINDCMCIMKDADCPACRALGKEGNFVVVLTVCDTQPYVPNSGPNKGKTLRNQRKLLYIKQGNLDRFERLYARNGNRFRGMLVEAARSRGDTTPGIGDDFQFIRFVPETELAKLKEHGQPVDYAKAFPVPTPEELRKQFGVGAVAGSEDTGSMSGSMDDVQF